MTRFALTANATAAAARRVTMAVFVELDFASGYVRAHDGIGPITFGGNTYLGVGQFGGIEVAEEAVEVIAKPLKLKLSGVDSTLVSSTMTEVYQNRSVTVYLGFMDEDSQLIGTPETVWEGRMNQMSISLTGGDATISLTCEHRLRREPRIARFTDADQKLVHPGDRFFDLLHTIPGYAGKWGQKDVRGGRGGSGSVGGSINDYNENLKRD